MSGLNNCKKLCLTCPQKAHLASCKCSNCPGGCYNNVAFQTLCIPNITTRKTTTHSFTANRITPHTPYNATQLYTIPFHTTPHQTTPPHHTTSNHTTPHHTTPHHTTPHHTTPHHTTPHHTTPHHTTPHHTTPHHTTPHHTTPHHTTPHHTTPHHTTPNHNTAQQITTHHTTPQHNTTHHTAQQHIDECLNTFCHDGQCFGDRFGKTKCLCKGNLLASTNGTCPSEYIYVIRVIRTLLLISVTPIPLIFHPQGKLSCNEYPDCQRCKIISDYYVDCQCNPGYELDESFLKCKGE